MTDDRNETLSDEGYCYGKAFEKTAEECKRCMMAQRCELLTKKKKKEVEKEDKAKKEVEESKEEKIDVASILFEKAKNAFGVVHKKEHPGRGTIFTIASNNYMFCILPNGTIKYKGKDKTAANCGPLKNEKEVEDLINSIKENME